MTRFFLLLGLLATLAACGKQPDDGPVAVSVIGDGLPALANPDRRALTPAEAVLVGATAQGLVRFDASGQIEPGLAIRWAVSDDGIYYDFRTAEESPINAEQTARAFRAAMAPTSRNALKFLFGAVAEVVAVTPEVVEFRLRAPRPNMLQLLAQPELALFDKQRNGTGPFRVLERAGGMLLLDPVADADTADLDEAERERRQVRLRGEPAAVAVARFEAGATALVLGGSFADLLIARAANLPANALRFDPALGLFGLEIASVEGFAGTAENRRALSMAIDREAIVAAFGGAPGWRVAETLVPDPLADLPAPAPPDFIATNLAIRRALARETVANWVAREGAPPRVRVAMPGGAGGRLLFGLLQL
ncbi:MAG TPA: ABC transporter substrate-binding protein, partial [Sphingomonadaceae bacterium]|nr:ABC transporter substrate-binding protein [Sphingomonadaceae bacterium]